jgi:hypothetical protein
MHSAKAHIRTTTCLPCARLVIHHTTKCLTGNTCFAVGWRPSTRQAFAMYPRPHTTKNRVKDGDLTAVTTICRVWRTTKFVVGLKLHLAKHKWRLNKNNKKTNIFCCGLKERHTANLAPLLSVSCTTHDKLGTFAECYGLCARQRHFPSAQFLRSLPSVIALTLDKCVEATFFLFFSFPNSKQNIHHISQHYITP